MQTVDVTLVERARAIAERGAAKALESFREALTIDNKAGPGAFDPVTRADRDTEAVIREAIAAEFPTHGILGEEYGESGAGAGWRWVIDPIDGTRGFMCGTPTWTTLVAVERDGVPVVGVVVQPHIKETWVGRPGRTEYHGPIGAQSGTRVVHTSQVEKLEEARLSTTDPRSQPAGYFRPYEASAFASLGSKVKVARFGHDAYAYALLASGHLDLVIETGLQRYDVSALIPVVEGAGGRISDWEGRPGHGASRIVAAATPRLHEAALDALSGASG